MKIFSLSFFILLITLLLTSQLQAVDPFDQNLALYRKVASYQETLKKEPENTEVLRNLAVTYGRLQLYDKALDCCLLMVRLEPESPRFQYNLGWCYQKMGSMEIAITTYKKARSLDPNIESIHYNLAVALQENKKFEEALLAVEAGLAKFPDSPKLFLAAAEIHRQSQNLVKAKQLAEKSLSLHQNNFDAYYTLTLIALAENNTSEAELQYKQARKLNNHLKDIAEEDDELRKFSRKIEESLATSPQK